MAELKKYLRGSTIRFYVGKDTTIDLDSNDFKLLFKRSGQTDIDFNKSQLTQVEPNYYYGEIPNTVTKKMHTGDYVMEILIGTSDTDVVAFDAFSICDSNSKKHVL